MSASLQRWSMLTCRRALMGMDGAAASEGSCTIVVPPRSLIAINPAVPSSSWPVSTTPTTAGPYASAAERNSGSIAGRARFSCGPWDSRT